MRTPDSAGGGVGPRAAAVGPLSSVWREKTEAYGREYGLEFRRDSSNRDTKRGLIRDEILPLLRRLHPGADENLLALAGARPRLPRALERNPTEHLPSSARKERPHL